MTAVPGGSRRVLSPIAREADRLGTKVYAVGGCVRDWLLGRPTKDIDLVLEADPGPLARFCSRRWGGRLESFDRFGTARVRGPGGLRLDFVRAREETYPRPAALPEVRPGSLIQDLARRDFTAHAMAAELGPDGSARLVDPYGGEADLRRGELRVLHEASFRDDPTRIFRAARYAGRYGWALEEATERLRLDAMEYGHPYLLSRVRIRAELVRMLEEADPAPSLELLRRWELAPLLHPRFRWPSRLPGGAWERLGLIALELGPDGGEFLKSLNLERPLSRALLEALELARAEASPREVPAPLTRRVLRAALKGLPKAALEPVRIGGDDLRRLGLEPGPEFKRWIEAAARAQWAGEFESRAEALRWLKREFRARQ